MNIRKFALLAFMATLIGCHTVDPGTAGVIIDWDGVQTTPMPEGFHSVNPFTDTIVNYPVKIQVYNAPASAMSKDMQLANTQVTVNYKVATADTPILYQTVGMIDDLENVLIRPKVQDTVKKYTAQYAAEQLIGDRETVTMAIKDELVAELVDLNITVTEVSLTNFTFADEFQKAVEDKQIAEQQAKTAMNEVEIVRADAAKTVVRAEANAKATLEQATAQAEANRLLDRSLTDKVIRYEAMQKWDGHYPKVVSGEGSDLLISID